MDHEDHGNIVTDILNGLFQSQRHSSGREYTNREVARAVNDRYGAALGLQLDPSSIARIRDGTTRDPGRKTILALCLFFQVSPEVFFPEIAAQRPAPTDENLFVLLRSVGLPAEVQPHIQAVIQALRTGRAESP